MTNTMKKNIIKTIITFVLFFNIKFIMKLIILIFGIKKINDSNFTILYLVSYIIMLILLFFIYKKELIEEWKKFKKNISKNLDIGFKYWLIGLAIMIGSNIIINMIFGKGQSNNETAVQSMITALPIVMLISAGIIGPIIEEIVFRKSIKNLIKRKWLFIITSALIFGFVHITSANDIKQLLFIIPYSALGYAFASMYYETDTIYTSIVMHQIHNITLTLLSILF